MVRSERTALLLLALTAGLLRFAVLFPSPHPAGTDGYYYVVQVEDLVARGSLHVPDASWVLRWLALPHVLGLDPAVSVALASATLASCCVLAAAALGACHSRAAGMLLALYAVASPTLTHLAADFPKNLGAIPVAWASLALLLGDRGDRRLRVALALLGALASALAHRTGAVFVGAGALGWLLGRALSGWSARALGASFAAIAVAVGLFAAASAILPGLMHQQDLERVWSQLRAVPWPPPPLSWLPHRRTDPAQLCELVVVPWGALLFGAAALRSGSGTQHTRAALGALLLPLSIALFPWWRADGLDLAYRLSLLAPLIGAPLCVFALAELRILATRPQLARLGLLLLPLSLFGYDPDSAPPYARYDHLIQLIPKPLPALLIVEPGASFYYDHRTGQEALAWAPEPEIDRQSTFRIVWGIRDGEWAAYTPIDAAVRPHRLDRDYVYVREDVWEAFVARARAEGDDDLRERIVDRRNPSRVRPASLLRNR